MGKKRRKKDTSTQAPATGAGRLTVWLSGQASTPTWRDATAFVAGLLTVVATSGGLVYWLPWLQLGVVVGAVVGLLASSTSRAMIAGLGVALLGALIAPANSWTPQGGPFGGTWETLGFALAVIAVAAGVSLLSSSASDWMPDILVALALVLIVGNLWATTLTINTFVRFDPINQEYIPPLNEQLRGNVPEAIATSDDALYFNVYSAMRDGEGYYQSFDRFMVERQGAPASSFLNFRVPLIFYAWSALPGPQWVVWGFLVLASVTVLAVAMMASRFVNAPLGIPAAGALASYFMVFPVQLVVLMQEPWAVSLSILSLVALVFSAYSGRWRFLVAVGVAAAVLGALVRETLVFFLIAGTFAAWIAPREQRVIRLGLWVLGWAVFAAVYAMHAIQASAYTDPASSAGRFSPGGVPFVLGAIEYATKHLGAGGILPYTLAGLGLLGAYLMPRREIRVLVLVATLLPLASFMVFGNDALDAASGRAVNYWGATVVPLLYACIPLAFLVVPGAAANEGTVRG